jgi:hypothetical protein
MMLCSRRVFADLAGFRQEKREHFLSTDIVCVILFVLTVGVVEVLSVSKYRT